MTLGRVFLQPTLKQILASEALSEAQVLAGEKYIERPVLQVVFGFSTARAGSLVVAPADALGSQDAASLKDLAGVLVIPEPAAALASVIGGTGRLSLGVGIETERLAALFTEAKTALVMVPGMGDAAQVAEDVRLAFQSEIKRAIARMQARYLAVVLETGLRGLAEELSSQIDRPVAIESSDFNLLAAENMGGTPLTQQRTLTEEVAEELNREMRAQPDDVSGLLPEQPFRLGRRLVMPIILEGVVVGYLSVMIKPSDDIGWISEVMTIASLSALVDFNTRRKEVSTFNVTQKSLLKDLLSGRTLSAGDQERLEQHFGFDLCDGFIVLALQILPPSAARDVMWPEDRYAIVEMESARVFVLPHDSKQGKTWQQEAEALVSIIKKAGDKFKVQLGAGRVATNLLDLSDAYREARQTLIIGSMIKGDEEFQIGYGELGIKRLLYLLIDHPELDRFYEETLSQLEAYDAEWESELLPTLRVYLEQGANLNSAAKELFIHRHTMRYRLEQIAEILVVDIDSPEVLLNLQIAFLIRDMRGKPKI